MSLLAPADFSSILHSKNRQTLHDGGRIRESVEAAHLHMSPKGLQVNVADAADRTAAAWLEPMQQPFAFFLLLKLLLNVNKNPRIHAFDLEFTAPSDCVLQRRPFPMQRLDRTGNHPPLLRQVMPQTGTDFSQRPLLMLKCQQVTASRDSIIQPVVLPLKYPRSTRLEQFRMNGTSEQVQSEFFNFGTNV